MGRFSAFGGIEEKLVGANVLDGGHLIVLDRGVLEQGGAKRGSKEEVLGNLISTVLRTQLKGDMLFCATLVDVSAGASVVEVPLQNK